jgi:hypothetical protein
MPGTVAALARSAPRALTDHTNVWLLVAAACVGFAAAWLIFEVRRAWSPESLRSGAEPAPAPQDTETLERVVPMLVEEVTELRRELAELRTSDARQLLAGLERVRGGEDSGSVRRLRRAE